MKILKLALQPEIALDPQELEQKIRQKIGLTDTDQVRIVTRKRSIDARSKQVLVRLEVEVYSEESQSSIPLRKIEYNTVENSDPVIIVGAGPAGLFAAIRLIELGFKPIIVERGKDVQARRRDLVAINRDHFIDEDSNYCFGEGGAGTYSDGKLYTRSKKRGDAQKVLELLVAHGAPEDILIDSHPHIGTNKLPKVVAALRQTITVAGGEIYFQSRIIDFQIKAGTMIGVKDRSGTTYQGKAVILATGHSARDVFLTLARLGVGMEAKPFAVGVRVEHPQSLIDRIQYHRTSRGLLPAASYTLNHQIKDQHRGVFSFCMCPGGFIVPAATSPGELVVNGMSPSRRDSKFANSGIVVSVDQKDFKEYQSQGPLAGMFYQRAMEQRACMLAGGTQAAPAQRLMDFMQGRVSANLPASSYQPGLTSVEMTQIFPEHIHQGIKEGFKMFGKRMRGYMTNEAQIVGVESRTSSPVRIPRDKESLQHPEVPGLFPCGEGAGYAGGIMSAALDGIRCADAVLRSNNI